VNQRVVDVSCEVPVRKWEGKEGELNPVRFSQVQRDRIATALRSRSISAKNS
jgi:hypothetical protein